MKYIKLYEDFSDKVLDNLEDIKWIIVSFCDDVISYKLLNNYEDKLIVYSLSCEQNNLEEFESLEGRIKDLNPNYEYVITKGKIAIGLPEYLKVFEVIDKYKIENYTFNDDFSIDVNGCVNLYNRGLTKIPIVFRNVSGNFNCDSNNLTSLLVSPKTVGGDFSCDDNKLESLLGSPKTIGGNFYCSNNKLTSLKGCPKTLGVNFYCYDNDLTSLLVSPETVGGNFDCSYNNLTSLDGSPKTVGGDFICRSNNLKSFEGGPETVLGDFKCSSNRLTSLDGIGDVKGHIISN